MRPLAAFSLAVLLVLAGCSAPFIGGPGNNTTAQPSPTGDQTAATVTDSTTETSVDTSKTTGTTTAEGTPVQNLPDPPQDVLGWEGGLWYNESISVSTKNGLNESEQSIVVNRTMARIETIRHLEYKKPVPVTVIAPAEYQRWLNSLSKNYSEALRTFHNVKYEAMFLVGEKNDSLAAEQSYWQTIPAYYSIENDTVVVVASTETLQLNRATLTHELAHALQDQHFNLSVSAPTLEAFNAYAGVFEGGAVYIQHRYSERCGDKWQCLDVPREIELNYSGRTDFNYGVFFLKQFKYYDGPQFIDYIYDHKGWSGVNALYEDLPSTEQVIQPRKYGRDSPRNVTIRETHSNGWMRVRPDRRLDYAVLGQSALSTMFARTIFDNYNRGREVIPAGVFIDYEASYSNYTGRYDYDMNATNGWDGDRMYIYSKNNATGYVWKITWDSQKDAREFVRAYEQLLAHWGGDRVREAGGNVWVIKQNSPFTDAFRITRRGDTVIIVNAPQVEDLNDVHARPGDE